MKISSRVDYAVSCAIHVAERYGCGGPVPVKYIAEQERLEMDYAERLLIVMKQAGILKSVRGVKGGYLLAADPEAISVYDIMTAFEGDVMELVCFRKKGRQRQCIHFKGCRVREFWQGLRINIETYLRNTTLRDLVTLRSKERH